jgi:hypothetical protein
MRDEWSFFADGDDENVKGMKFRIRPDRHVVNKETEEIKWIIDWKTTEDIKKLLRYGFWDFGYDIQDVFYSDVIGINPTKFLFVCVEKSAPYSARIIKLGEDAIENAREKMINSIGRISAWQSDPTKTDIDMPEIIEI